MGTLGDMASYDTCSIELPTYVVSLRWEGGEVFWGLGRILDCPYSSTVLCRYGTI